MYWVSNFLEFLFIYLFITSWFLSARHIANNTCNISTQISLQKNIQSLTVQSFTSVFLRSSCFKWFHSRNSYFSDYFLIDLNLSEMQLARTQMLAMNNVTLLILILPFLHIRCCHQLFYIQLQYYSHNPFSCLLLKQINLLIYFYKCQFRITQLKSLLMSQTSLMDHSFNFLFIIIILSISGPDSLKETIIFFLAARNISAVSRNLIQPRKVLYLFGLDLSSRNAFSVPGLSLPFPENVRYSRRYARGL